MAGEGIADQGAEAEGGEEEGDRFALQDIELKNVKVKTADYIQSCVSVDKCPEPRYPEFAVIGRSNVGKSSLINLMTGRKGLAMVSKTPGKTKTINHFLVNNEWYLVDLPGYGYAKTGEGNKITWMDYTQEYFLEREPLANVLLLVDSSIPPQQVDVDCACWLADHEVPFSIVFTKMDKRKKKTPPNTENMQAFQDMLLEVYEDIPAVLATSAQKGEGGYDLLRHVARLRELWKMSKEE